jgi:hypothetical protein
MTPDELQAWLEDNEPPFVFKTKGGRSYRVTDRANVWIPAAYPAMVCVGITGRGITMIKVSAIECVQIEHDVAGSR